MQLIHNHNRQTWLLLQAMRPRAVHASFIQTKQAIAHNIIRHYVEETSANDPSALGAFVFDCQR